MELGTVRPLHFHQTNASKPIHDAVADPIQMQVSGTYPSSVRLRGLSRTSFLGTVVGLLNGSASKRRTFCGSTERLFSHKHKSERKCKPKAPDLLGYQQRPLSCLFYGRDGVNCSGIDHERVQGSWTGRHVKTDARLNADSSGIYRDEAVLSGNVDMGAPLCGGLLSWTAPPAASENQSGAAR